MGKKKAKVSFDEYYSEVLGDRWTGLKAALLSREGEKYKLHSPFNNEIFYELDEASVIAAQALKIEPGQNVLDMCAAPGGKSLTMIYSVMAEAEFTLNDQSLNRLGRLKRVIREHVPESFNSRIRITHRDATRWGLYEPEHYDRILLDAPCSGEKHLLENPNELNKWSPSRGDRLAQQQYALLCSAAMSLKPGGRMVYSTCTVNPKENDFVVKKFLSKKKGALKVELPQSTEYEPTDYGVQIWPDHSSNLGPIYFCVLSKEV